MTESRTVPMPKPQGSESSTAGLQRLRGMVDESQAATHAYQDATRRNSLLTALAKIRERAGLRQADVAQKMGTTQSGISELERGRSDAYVGTLQRYARATNHRLDVAVVAEKLPVYDAGLANGLWATVQRHSMSPLLTRLVTARKDPSKRRLKELADAAALPEPVVQAVLMSLADRDWVSVDHTTDDAKTVYSLRESAGYVIGISLHTHRIEGVLLDSFARVIERTTRPLAQSDLATVRTKIVDVAVELHARAQGRNILGVGVALAGVVDPHTTGPVKFASDLEGGAWTNCSLELQLQNILQERLDDDTLLVAVENDANALALLQYWLTGDDSVAVILMSGSGIGAGFIANGNVVYGASYSAGEIGHLIVDPNGPDCRMGLPHRGCLETVASVQGILHALGQPHDDAVLLDELRKANMRVRLGDETAYSAFYTAGKALGQTGAKVTAIIDPSRIVIYGHADLVRESDASADAFRAGFLAGWTESRSENKLYSNPSIEWTALEDETNAIGAGGATMRLFMHDPPRWRPQVVGTDNTPAAEWRPADSRPPNMAETAERLMPV